MLSRLLLFVTLIIMLSACGGGSSSAPPSQPTPAPQPPTPSIPVGLTQRPDNQSCIASDYSPAGSSSIGLSQVFTGLPGFSQPLGMMQAPQDNSRWFVLEKTGRVRVFNNSSGVSTFNNDFINLDASFSLNTSGEGGLLGMAFHPDYASNGEVYLSWTEGSSPMRSVIARFTSNNGGLTLDPGSREDIITINQDFSNHNGGNIAFGQDGHLYIGMGDGGSGGDPNSRAQDTTNMLGAFLRLDVDNTAPYTIPATNPFAGNPMCQANHSSLQSCPEIFAWGVRNPWRWSFDLATGELWAGDVGQSESEEIDIIQLNGNYGWDCREGDGPFSGLQSSSCQSAGSFIDPVHTFPRNQGTSVTGGFVYRGAALPGLTGHYLFGDYGSGRIWQLTPDGSGGWNNEELLDTSLSIASFGQDNSGELYVIDIAGGGLYQIIDAGSPPPSSSVATSLSATGCVNPASPAEAGSGMIPYDINAPFWSDNAVKERWFAIPDGTSINVMADGDFSFPVGSVLMKHFRLGNQLIETRLLMRHNNGDWAGYSYEWNATQTDADLVQGGKVVDINGQNWIYPSSNDCLTCHTNAAGFALGPEVAQLNRDYRYSSTGVTANQLHTLNSISMFSTTISSPATLDALVDPADTSATLNERARSYLHTNCAQCHRTGGPTPSSMDLHYDTALEMTASCDEVPQSGALGLGGAARIILPGEPDLSVLVNRIERRDVYAMPPLGSNVVDSEGAALIRSWIASLGSCQE